MSYISFPLLRTHLTSHIGIDCLSPSGLSIVGDRPRPVPVNKTNTTITVSWTAPALPEECDDVVFSLATFTYEVRARTDMIRVVPGYPRVSHERASLWPVSLIGDS